MTPSRRPPVFLVFIAPLLVAAQAHADAPGVATTRPLAESEQYEARRVDFEVAGRPAFLIHPTQPAPDGARPWIWYAPTFKSHLPNERHAWMMRRFLAAGFHVAGIDVGESYGSPAGRKMFDALYDVLTREFALAEKPCLLPQSRGGLMLYNWAADHPDRVQCIGGIYPVCDLSSYPGLERAADAYGMTAEQLRLALAEHNPVDRLGPLAQRKIPILHLHGTRDTIVPTEVNSAELMKRYRALSGPGELEVIAGKGHEEVDEFFRSETLVKFFLSQQKRIGWGRRPIGRAGLRQR